MGWGRGQWSNPSHRGGRRIFSRVRERLCSESSRTVTFLITQRCSRERTARSKAKTKAWNNTTRGDVVLARGQVAGTRISNAPPRANVDTVPNRNIDFRVDAPCGRYRVRCVPPLLTLIDTNLVIVIVTLCCHFWCSLNIRSDTYVFRLDMRFDSLRERGALIDTIIIF